MKIPKYDSDEFKSLYKKLLIQQKNKCAICGKHKSLQKCNLNIDHNHKTGKVRGLLCNSCNLGLGSFQDSSILLNRAAKYINKWKIHTDSYRIGISHCELCGRITKNFATFCAYCKENKKRDIATAGQRGLSTGTQNS